MAIKPFREVPANAFEWARYLQTAEVSPSDGSITDETFASRAPYSVIGRPSGTAGAPSDIAATADGHVLTRRAGVLQFDGLTDSDIPSGIARDTEVSAAVSTGISDHVAESDPHSQYLLPAEADTLYTAIQTTGTYTGAFTGTTTDPAPPLRWSRVGRLVALYIPQTSATSNATSFTITGAPTTIRPARAQNVQALVRDNGTVAYGLASMSTGGVLTLGLGASGGVFTNSGTKGVELQTLTYSLD